MLDIRAIASKGQGGSFPPYIKDFTLNVKLAPY